jgi:NADH-quinone oxidoreductase subunit K
MIGSDSALNNYLVVGALLFALGLVGFVARRNLIVQFLCVELMLQGVSLTLVAFSTYHATWDGQVFALFSLALAAAEAGVALALFVALFRRRQSLDVSLWQELREPDQPPVRDEPAVEAPAVEKRWPALPLAGVLPSRVEGEDGAVPRPAAHAEPVGAEVARAEGARHD